MMILDSSHEKLILFFPCKWKNDIIEKLPSPAVMGIAPILLVQDKWALTPENLTFLHANNKGADQPAHSHSLISTFVICNLKIMISIFAS